MMRRELLGLTLLALSLGGAAAWVSPAPLLLHPVAGTALALLADAALERRRGASPLTAEPQSLVWIATLSVFLWALIESLNERLGIWAYLGWPADDLPRYALLGWTFASILPLMAFTAEFLGGRRAWELREPSPLTLVAALAGLTLFGLTERGALSGARDIWFSAGVAGLFLAGAGLRHAVRRIAAWSAAGLLWIAVSEALNVLAGAQRVLVSPDGITPALGPAALLLGPALGGLYQEAVTRFGLAGWPPQGAAESSDRILS